MMEHLHWSVRERRDCSSGPPPNLITFRRPSDAGPTPPFADIALTGGVLAEESMQLFK
jgi:hypothetical protein